MWILLMVFNLCTFTVILETREQCAELGQLNADYWRHTGQTAKAVCMPTTEI